MILKKHLYLIACNILIICACSQKDSLDSYKKIKQEFGGKILAKVEDRELTDEMVKEIAKNIQLRSSQGNTLPKTKKEIVENWINMQLLYFEARNSRIAKDPGFILEIQLQYDGLLTSRFLATQLQDIKISDKDIQDYYNNNKDKLFVLKTDIKLFNRVFIRDSTKAINTLSKIRKAGNFLGLKPEDHDDLNYARSKGVVGWRDKPNTMKEYGPSIGIKVWALKKGELTDEPIKVKNGYLILQCKDTKTKGSYLSLQETQAKIRQILLDKKRKKKTKQILENLKEKYKPQNNL